jgi:hypothetical protein
VGSLAIDEMDGLGVETLATNLATLYVLRQRCVS